VSRLSNWFSSLFSKPPHKNCVAKALECAKELKKRMPDAEVVTVTGLMLDKDDHRMPRFEKGRYNVIEWQQLPNMGCGGFMSYSMGFR